MATTSGTDLVALDRVLPRRHSVLTPRGILSAGALIVFFLALVGGGGLGQLIYHNVQFGFYSRLSTLILLIYALVLASDWTGEGLCLRVA